MPIIDFTQLCSVYFLWKVMLSIIFELKSDIAGFQI